MDLNLLTPRLRAGISPCGCLHESLRRHRVIQVWRCPMHDDRYVRAEALLPRRRCESCGSRRARYRLTFGDYSLGNWLLLWSQAEKRATKVTRPAGYRTWQRMGRQVRRGERGYQILAPITRRVTRDDDEEERIVTGFRVVHVFDIRQTDGEPLPDVGPRRLTGDGDARLLEVGIGMIEDQGYRPSSRHGRRAARSLIGDAEAEIGSPRLDCLP